MHKKDRKAFFRIIGSAALILGLVFRFHPRVVLPNEMSWSGDFAVSEWGLRLAAFSDVMNIAVVCGAALLILSFTTLTDAD